MGNMCCIKKRKIESERGVRWTKKHRDKVDFQRDSSRLRTLQNELEDERKRYRRLEKTYQKVHAEHDDLTNRYSSFVSAQISNDNPNIVDLSDSNRPTKIAEMYSELYDNEWTEAFDVLEQSGLTEQDSISQLLKIITCVYQICQQRAQEQIEALTHFGKMSVEVLKGLKDGRKANFKQEVTLLNEVTKKTLEEHLSTELLQDGRIQRYIDECLLLCWLMSIQDPPLYMDIQLKSEDEMLLNKNYYRPYTSSGEMVDFYVWPALFLHENGNLLLKGTAQGKARNVQSSSGKSRVNGSEDVSASSSSSRVHLKRDQAMRPEKKQMSIKKETHL